MLVSVNSTEGAKRCLVNSSTSSPRCPIGKLWRKPKGTKKYQKWRVSYTYLIFGCFGVWKKHHSLNIMPLKKSMQLTQVGIPPFFSVSSIFFRYLKVFMSGAWMKLFWGEVFEKMPVVGGFHPPKNGSILPGARKNM